MESTYLQIESRLSMLREREATVYEGMGEEYTLRFEIGWIYHDAAMEGVVLTYSEIKASIDRKIISDVTLIPSYQEIKQFKKAIDWARDRAADKKYKIGLDTIMQLHAIIDPEEGEKGSPFRKENPLHRLYYHEISQPEKIAASMKAFGEWMDEPHDQHPIERAARVQHKFMAIFPWLKHSGRVGRLLSNMILMRDGFRPALLHAIDRQKYYEALKTGPKALVQLYAEAEQTSIETALRFYQEALNEVARQAS